MDLCQKLQSEIPNVYEDEDGLIAVSGSKCKRLNYMNYYRCKELKHTIDNCNIREDIENAIRKLSIIAYIEALNSSDTSLVDYIKGVSFESYIKITEQVLNLEYLHKEYSVRL